MTVKVDCRWLRLLVLVPLVIACTPTLRWVRDIPSNPSCVPDRLLTWDDFSPRSTASRRTAETAVRFHLSQDQPPRIQAAFDRDLSWVKPQVVDHPDHKRSDRLLRHEQVHFAISCLLTREANLALRTGGDPHGMLFLLNAVATRINVQYDVETNHGLNVEEQERWEDAIQARMAAGPLRKTANQSEH